jgi:hypothetical protein
MKNDQFPRIVLLLAIGAARALRTKAITWDEVVYYVLPEHLVDYMHDGSLSCAKDALGRVDDIWCHERMKGQEAEVAALEALEADVLTCLASLGTYDCQDESWLSRPESVFEVAARPPPKQVAIQESEDWFVAELGFAWLVARALGQKHADYSLQREGGRLAIADAEFQMTWRTVTTVDHDAILHSYAQAFRACYQVWSDYCTGALNLEAVKQAFVESITHLSALRTQAENSPQADVPQAKPGGGEDE